MAATKDRIVDTATWKGEITKCGDRADMIVAVMQRLAHSMLFYPEAMEFGFERISALSPSFAVVEKACEVTNCWYQRYAPSDDGWGWFDLEEFSLDHSNACYELWEDLSRPLVESASDFYSALEAAKHSHPRESFKAQEKMREFAAMPEHLLDWVEYKADLGHGFSEREHRKFVEIVMAYNLDVPISPTTTRDPDAVRSLQRVLQHLT